MEWKDIEIQENKKIQVTTSEQSIQKLPQDDKLFQATREEQMESNIDQIHWNSFISK